MLDETPNACCERFAFSIAWRNSDGKVTVALIEIKNKKAFNNRNLPTT